MAIAALKHMPAESTIRRWLRMYEQFRSEYARAREESAHASADLVKSYADRTASGTMKPDAARVAIDAEKWIAGKRKPKVYGDRQILDLGDETLKQLSEDRLDARVIELSRKAGIAGLIGGTGTPDAGEPA